MRHPEQRADDPWISDEGVDLRKYRVDADTPFELDADCQELVALHPNGMTLDEIGRVLWAGNRPRWSKKPKAIRNRRDVTPRPLSRERIRQIEAEALRKLRRARKALADTMRDG